MAAIADNAPLESLQPTRAGRGIYTLSLIVGAVMTVIACMALPWSPYIAWQQSAGTDMFHSRWIYERLHFDPAPIEVAFIGSSRFEAAISAPVLQEGLSRRLGRPVTVANLALVRPGRDLHAEIVDHLLQTHPEVRLIVLADDGDMASSHPMFAQVARPWAVATSPWFVNSSYFSHVLGLPYRGFANMLAQAFPAWNGVATNFDVQQYLGTDLDRSQGYVLPSGRVRNGNIVMPVDELKNNAAAVIVLQQAGMIGKLPLLSERDRYIVDRVYTEKIAAAAKARNVKIAFVRLPVYGPRQLAGNKRFYEAFGPDFSLDGLAKDPALFQDGLHMNHAGALLVSSELVGRLAPLVCDKARGPSC